MVLVTATVVAFEHHVVKVVFEGAELNVSVVLWTNRSQRLSTHRLD